MPLQVIAVEGEGEREKGRKGERGRGGKGERGRGGEGERGKGGEGERGKGRKGRWEIGDGEGREFEAFFHIEIAIGLS
jgi:hypothetical protein